MDKGKRRFTSLAVSIQWIGSEISVDWVLAVRLKIDWGEVFLQDALCFIDNVFRFIQGVRGATSCGQSTLMEDVLSAVQSVIVGVIVALLKVLQLIMGAIVSEMMLWWTGELVQSVAGTIDVAFLWPNVWLWVDIQVWSQCNWVWWWWIYRWMMWWSMELCWQLAQWRLVWCDDVMMLCWQLAQWRLVVAIHVVEPLVGTLIVSLQGVTVQYKLHIECDHSANPLGSSLWAPELGSSRSYSPKIHDLSSHSSKWVLLNLGSFKEFTVQILLWSSLAGLLLGLLFGRLERRLHSICCTYVNTKYERVVNTNFVLTTL